MVVVIAAAIGAAALRSASALWADTLLTLTPAAVGFAILAAVYREGGPRAYWFGFALFAGGYFWLAFGPWPGLAPKPRLLTGRFLVAMHSRSGSPSVAARPDPPVRPGQYVEAMDRLVGVHDDMAAQYCRAAFNYRDMLSDRERAKLFERRELLAPEEVAILAAEHENRATAPKGTIEDFERAGQSLIGLAVGCLGGIVGLSLFNSRHPRGIPEGGMDQP
jgi:hypothetical protein